MEITNLFWTIGGTAFLTGLVVGILLYHFLTHQRATINHKARITQLENELNSYKNKVTNHFSTSAHLINRMTENYRAIHEHLASSANELCADEKTRHRLNDALLASQVLERENASHAQPQQPKDYAPKSDSKEKTLSENFRVAPHAANKDKNSAA